MNPTATTTAPPASAPSAPSSPERCLDYSIYKPNSRGSGGVVRFGLNPYKGAVFIDGALQSGEKQFDWERKVTMKWGFSDLGAVLAVLQGRTTEAKLFHQSEHANSAFELIYREEPDRAPYSMAISRQDAADKSLRKVRIPVSHAEAAVLEGVLRRAVTRILGW